MRFLNASVLERKALNRSLSWGFPLSNLLPKTCVLKHRVFQEDVNGEKLTVKNWWIFGAEFSRFTQSSSRFIRDINGEKNISLLMIFFTVSFSRFAPSRVLERKRRPNANASVLGTQRFRMLSNENRSTCKASPPPRTSSLAELLLNAQQLVVLDQPLRPARSTLPMEAIA